MPVAATSSGALLVASISAFAAAGGFSFAGLKFRQDLADRLSEQAKLVVAEQTRFISQGRVLITVTNYSAAPISQLFVSPAGHYEKWSDRPNVRGQTRLLPGASTTYQWWDAEETDIKELSDPWMSFLDANGREWSRQGSELVASPMLRTQRARNRKRRRRQLRSS